MLEQKDGKAASKSASGVRRAGLALGWLGVLLPFVIDAIAIGRANRIWLLHRLPDDALYYFEITRRLGRGEGYTFDGINETNGFHPLWQALLVPISWIFPGDVAYIRAALVLGLIVSLIGLLLVMRVVWRAWGPGPALLGGVVAANSLSLSNGMEGPAVVLALALLLTAFTWFAEAPDARRAFVCGLAAAFCILARFDLIAVVWVVPLVLGWRARSFRLGAWCAGGAVCLGVPFGTYWLQRWGHVLTTSATVKDGLLTRRIDEQYGGRFSVDHLRFVYDTFASYAEAMLSTPRRSPLRGTSPLRDILSWVVTALALVGLVVTAPKWRTAVRGKDPLAPTAWALVVMGAIVAVKGLIDVVVAPPWAAAWYSAPQRLAISFLCGALVWCALHWILARSQPAAIAAGVAVVLACIPALWPLTTSGDAVHKDGLWQDQMDLAGDWVLVNGPPGRYGGNDAGLLGFRLDGDFAYVNLDGLVNDYEFAEFLDDDPDMLSKAKREGVDVLVGRFRDDVMSGLLSCGDVLWTSPGKVPYADQFIGYTEAPVYVVDVRGCS